MWQVRLPPGDAGDDSAPASRRPDRAARTPLRVLADPTRIELLDLLRQREASVQELTETIGSTQQNVSKHLRVLLEAGIVGRRKLGNYAYYSVTDEGVFALCEDVCGSLAEQLESLREVVGAGR
jgi:DNA-binding transcriptional ArsR family regulator